MRVSPDILRRETLKILNQIEKQIDEVEKEAEATGIPPEKLRDFHGNWVMIPLLLAKTQAYSMLVQLQSK